MTSIAPDDTRTTAATPPARIGFDLRVFQIGHQFRGIGAVAKAIITELDQRLAPNVTFVGFADPVTSEITDLFDTLVRTAQVADTRADACRPHPIIEVAGNTGSKIGKVRNVCDPAFETAVAEHADVIVQFDQLLGVPADVPSVIVVFDQIPLTLGDRYPISYKPTYGGARRAGMSRLTSANKAAARWRHERQLAAALDRAESIVVIS
ncbi:MAG TPA: hypothetical protein VFN21_06990, partial [Acidimicrobiales bacterium]|nr:hypothetical protein [Acidimicrobiales bacterium]